MRLTYLEGDPCSPKYVAGALRLSGWEVREDGPLDPVVVISDVTADQLGPRAAELADAVRRGAGALLVGGWFSFGRGGWGRSPLASIAPVAMHDGDDRVPCPAGLLLRPGAAHPVTTGLPWEEPVALVGHNRVEARGDVLIEGVRVEGVADGVARLGPAVPVLVCREVGAGRVAAFASDLAPHWSGGLTDWGTPALDVDEREQVGRGYARLLDNLCRWLARKT